MGFAFVWTDVPAVYDKWRLTLGRLVVRNAALGGVALYRLKLAYNQCVESRCIFQGINAAADVPKEKTCEDTRPDDRVPEGESLLSLLCKMIRLRSKPALSEVGSLRLIMFDAWEDA